MTTPTAVPLDATDRRLLALLQEDSARTNEALARARTFRRPPACGVSGGW